MLRRKICTLLMLATAYAARADDFYQLRLGNWHQWRGPLATGVSPTADPPTEWSDTKNIKWKVAIPGRGSASPVVWENHIFILSAIETDRTADQEQARDNLILPVRYFPDTLVQQDNGRRRRDGFDAELGGFSPRRFGRGRFSGEKPTNMYQFVVLCIDRRNGQTIWERTAIQAIPHEGHHQTGSFASASPCTNGRLVYAYFGSRGLYCYDFFGNLQWKKDLGQFRIRMGFGEGASPTLDGDTLVVNCDHENGSFIVALDAKTGEEKWRRSRDEGTTWGTPLVARVNGQAQVITTGTKRIRSYNLANGELLWECGGLGSNPIATPVTFDGLVIAMSGHQSPAGVAVSLTSRGDVTDSENIAWKIEGSTPYVSTPLLYDDTLYFVKSRNAIISSVNARTGEYLIHQQRIPGMSTIYSSPVAAKDRIYLASREGTTLVFRHAPRLEILATNHLDDIIDATPALVGREIIIRGEKQLYCIAEP